jgi:hypothetical protein
MEFEINNNFFFILIFCIIFLYLIQNQNKENFNEGTYYHINHNLRRHPKLEMNFDAPLYPLCTKSIRSNAVGERYCNDIPTYKRYATRLYDSDKWVGTLYPSYFYPPYSTSVEPNYSHSPDWWHPRI